MFKRILKQYISTLMYPLQEGCFDGAGLRILVYHSVDNYAEEDIMGIRISPDVFRKQMRDLRDWGYNVVDIGVIFNPSLIRDKSIILTFDDGYRDFLINALPVLDEFGYPATLFITTDYMSGIRKHNPAYWDNWPKLNWNEIKDIRKNKKVTIGSHGLIHQRLTGLKHDILLREIKGSKEIIEKNISSNVEYFSYPHGLHDRDCIPLLKEAGYKAAFTGKCGRFNLHQNIYEINRTEISRYNSSDFEFRKKIDGSYDWVSF